MGILVEVHANADRETVYRETIDQIYQFIENQEA